MIVFPLWGVGDSSQTGYLIQTKLLSAVGWTTAAQSRFEHLALPVLHRWHYCGDWLDGLVSLYVTTNSLHHTVHVYSWCTEQCDECTKDCFIIFFTALRSQDMCSCVRVFLLCDGTPHTLEFFWFRDCFLGMGMWLGKQIYHTRQLLSDMSNGGETHWQGSSEPVLYCCVKTPVSCIKTMTFVDTALTLCYLITCAVNVGKVWTKPFPALCGVWSAADDMWPFLSPVEEASVPQNIILELRGLP